MVLQIRALSAQLRAKIQHTILLGLPKHTFPRLPLGFIEIQSCSAFAENLLKAPSVGQTSTKSVQGSPGVAQVWHKIGRVWPTYVGQTMAKFSPSSTDV